MGRLSWSLTGLGIVVMEKRLADVGIIRWMKMLCISCWAVSVYAGLSRARTLRVNPSCLAAPGTRLIPGYRSGMGTVVMVEEVRRQGHESTFLCLYWSEDVFQSMICLNDALCSVMIKEVG